MLRNIAFALALAVAAFAGTAPSHAADADPVVLTVTGNVANANRGPVDEFEDAVFAHLQVKFDKGHTFTLADLRAMPQHTVKAKYEGFPREVEATGPSLTDVLKAAGAEGKKIVPQGLDGYAPEFTAADVAKDKMIVAIAMDGKPLAMGGRGPLWVFGPPGSFEGQQADEGFVFGLIRIDVQ